MTLSIDPTLQSLLPVLTDEERASLRSSIDRYGVLDAAKVAEDGTLLDGHNRYVICADLDVELPTVVVPGVEDHADKVEFVVRTNFGRRNMTKEARQALVHQLRNEHGLSQRKIAAATGIPKSTVADWVKQRPPVAESPATLMFDELKARVDAYPAKRVIEILPDETDLPARFKETGERLAHILEMTERLLWLVGEAILEEAGGVPTSGEAADIAEQISLGGGEQREPETLVVLATIAKLHPLDSLGRRPKGQHLWELAIGAPDWIKRELGWDGGVFEISDVEHQGVA